jgi:hypothetical protein
MGMGGAISRQKTDTFVGKKETPKKKKKTLQCWRSVVNKCCVGVCKTKQKKRQSKMKAKRKNGCGDSKRKILMEHKKLIFVLSFFCVVMHSMQGRAQNNQNSCCACAVPP